MIVILGVVGTIVSAAIISSLRTQRVTEANVLSNAEARLAVERTSLDIRTANPLREATSTSITVDTFRKGICERREYRLSGDELLLDVAPFAAGVDCNVANTSPGTAVTSLVAEGLTNGTTEPLFTYYRWDSTTDERVEVPAPVSTASLRLVDSVEIRVLVEAREQGDVETSTIVDLRNVDVR